MSFERLHRLIAYLLVACGFAMLSLSGELSDIILLAAAVIASISWFRAPSRSEEPSYVLTAVLVAVLAALVVLSFAKGEWLVNTVYFAVVMTAAKLFQCRIAKDFFQLYALTFLLVVGGAVLNPGVSFAFIFLAYVVLITWGLVLLHLRRDFEDRAVSIQLLHAEEESDEMNERREVGLWRGQRLLKPSFFVGTSILALVIFAASIVVFFAFPRLGLGFFFSGQRGGQDVAGFSSQVELGSFGTIKDDPSVIARVEFPDGEGPLLSPLRLRGLSFDRYDGRSWHRDSSRRNQELPALPNGTRKTGFNEEVRFASETLVQRVYLEPLNAPVHPVFGQPRVRAIRVEGSALKKLQQTYRKMKRKFFQAYPSGDITFSGASNRSIVYEVTSERFQGVPKGVENAGTDYSALLRRLYTAAGSEEGSAHADLQAQGERYRLSGPIASVKDTVFRKSQSPLEKVRAVEAYLADGFSYSLEGGHDAGDPLADFLLHRKEGHCEYFATAMVVLLQEVGVPARLITGFYGGVWNPYGSYYEIRQGDAHAWVEVYFPGYGWLTFDPTPAVGALAPIDDAWTAMFSRWIDSLKLQWYKWVIEYDLEKQVEMFREVGRRLATLRNPFFEERESGEKFFSLKETFQKLFSPKVLLFFVVLLMVMAFWFFWSKRRPSEGSKQLQGRRSDIRRARRYWRRTLHRVERAGLDVAPSHTPEEVVRNMASRGWTCANQVSSIGDTYQAIRFGERPLTKRDEEQMRAWLLELKDDLRRQKSA